MRALFVALLIGLPCCAGVGESVAGVCLAIAVQTAAEICCEAAVGVICDGDETIDLDRDASPPEVPPPPRETGDEPPPPACRQRALEGGVWRLDCVDGTSAEALVADPPEDAGGVIDVVVDDLPAAAGMVELTQLTDVARLSGVLGLAGSLRVSGPALLSVSLPSLRTVGGDLDIERTTQLRRLDLSALRQVGGTVRLLHNRVLQHDPCPGVARAAAVDVAFNDALPTTTIDRLLTLGPPATSPP